MKRIALVNQRYGLEVNGGSEFYTRLIAERLAEKYPDAMVLMSIFFEAVSSVQVNARTASINNCFLILVIICI